MVKILGIYATLETLKTGKQNIYYHTVDNYNAWNWYTENNVPDNIVELCNKNIPVKTWETEYTNTGTKEKTFAYRIK